MIVSVVCVVCVCQEILFGDYYESLGLCVELQNKITNSKEDQEE